jgi:uroporphyrinogen-III synthase
MFTKETSTSSDITPLKGVRVLVTRAVSQASSLTNRLEHLGATAIEIPVIEFKEPESWSEFNQALKHIENYQWILFASVNAVEAFFSRANALKISNFHNAKFAAIGPATAQAITQKQQKISFQPSSFIAEAIVEQFPNYPDLKGLKILWPRTNVGRKYMEEKLVAAGAHIDTVEAYRTVLPHNSKEISKQLIELLNSQSIDLITLTSSQAARNFAQLQSLIPQENESGTERGVTACRGALHAPVNTTEHLKKRRNILIASIGPQTTETAKQLFGKVDIEASEYTIEGLVSAISTYFTKLP